MSALPHPSELIPHQGAMCLNERIVDWDADSVRLTTTTHRSPANPLRHGGRLRALHLCEYGAQAMAVHGGLLAMQNGERARPGLLVALRDVRLRVDYIDALDGELRVEARRLIGGEDNWQYAFVVSHGERVLAEGRAAVMLRPRA